MVFVGYKLGSKAWRFYNPDSKRVHVSRDAMFEENMPWKWSNDNKGDVTDDGDSFTLEHVIAHGAPGPVQGTLVLPTRSIQLPVSCMQTPKHGGQLSMDDMQMPGHGAHSEVGDMQSSAFGIESPHQAPGPNTLMSSSMPSSVEFVLPLVSTLDLDVNADDAPRRFRTMQNILGSNPLVAPIEGWLKTCLQPLKRNQNQVKKEWHAAMVEELASIEEN
jgi:hypothetical protein